MVDCRESRPFYIVGPSDDKIPKVWHVSTQMHFIAVRKLDIVLTGTSNVSCLTCYILWMQIFNKMTMTNNFFGGSWFEYTEYVNLNIEIRELLSRFKNFFLIELEWAWIQNQWVLAQLNQVINEFWLCVRVWYRMQRWGHCWWERYHMDRCQLGIKEVMEERPALQSQQFHLLCPHHQRFAFSNCTISWHLPFLWDELINNIMSGSESWKSQSCIFHSCILIGLLD